MEESITLRELQGLALKYNKMYNDIKKRKDKMKGAIETKAKTLYTHELVYLYLRDCCKQINKREKIVTKRVFCSDDKEYLESQVTYIRKMLQQLKTDALLFKHLVDLIDNSKDITNDDRLFLAEEFVHLFLNDIAACKDSKSVYLFHMDTLIPTLLKKEELSADSFGGKLLKLYVERLKMVKYTRLILKESLTDLLRTTYCEDNEVEAEQIDDPLEETKDILLTTNKKTIEDIIDKILNNLIDKVNFMPLEFRFLCKLIEKHASAGSVISFLFNFWLEPALSSPINFNMPEILNVNTKLDENLNTIISTLRAVFGLNNAEVTKSRKDFINSYVAKVLNISYPILDIEFTKYIKIDNVCTSMRMINLIKTLLCKDPLKEDYKNNISYKSASYLESIQKQLMVKGLFIDLPTKQMNILDSEDQEPYFSLIETEFNKQAKNLLNEVKWQTIFNELLLNIDLPVKSKLLEMPINESTVIEIIKEIIRCPSMFALEESLVSRIVIIATYITNLFETETFMPNIKQLHEQYTKMIEDVMNESKEIEEEYRYLVKHITKQIASKKRYNTTYFSNIVSSIAAERIIKDLKMHFQIYKENDKYAIEFFDKAKNGILKRSTLDLQLFPNKRKQNKNNKVAEGNSINDFIKHLVKIKQLKDIIRANSDSNNLETVYKEFMIFIRKSLSMEYSTNIYRAVYHIENYIMHNLCSILLQLVPSEEDKAFVHTLNELKEKNVVNHLVQNNPVPNELLSLIVERLKESSRLTTPHQKLVKYKEVHKIINEGIDLFTKNQGVLVSCGQVQIFVLGVLYAKLPHLVSDVVYIERFMDRLTNKEKNYIKDIYYSIEFLKNIQL